jgi:hypothetical protein
VITLGPEGILLRRINNNLVGATEL